MGIEVISHSICRLRPLAFAVLEVEVHCVRHREGTSGNGHPCGLLIGHIEPCPGSRLGLCKGEDGHSVWVREIVSSPERMVDLAGLEEGVIVTGDPFPAFLALPVSEGSPFLHHHPVGLALWLQLGPVGPVLQASVLIHPRHDHLGKVDPELWQKCGTNG